MNPEREGYKKVVAWVGPDLHRRAKIKAAVTGRPIADVIREAIREWVEENEEQKTGE